MILNADQLEFIKTRSRDDAALHELVQFVETVLSPLDCKQWMDSMLGNSPEVVYRLRGYLDGTTEFEYISPNCLRLNGVEADEVMRDSAVLLDLIHPEDRAGYWAEVLRARRAVAPFVWEGRFIINGQVRWHHIESYPELQLDGSRISNGFQIDITERHTAEEALRMSEERHRIISEAISDYAFCTHVNDDGTLWAEWISGTYADFTGYTPEEVVALPPYALIYPDDIPLLETIVQRVIQGETVLSEYRVVGKQGQICWIRANRIPVWNAEKNRVIRYYCVAQHITEEKNAAEALQRQARLEAALEKERELSHLKTRMMTRIAHEFRTPLAAIATSTDLLERYLPRMTDDQRQTRFYTIHAQIGQITTMLDDIAYIITGQDSGLSLHSEPLDLKALCQAELHHIQVGLGSQHHFEFEYASPLPRLSADAVLIERVIRRLLSNAVKYSQPGTTIRTRLSQAERHIILSIQDEGIGIRPEDEPRIFETFFRGGNITETPGLGLGLRIAKDIAEMHGGTLAFSSQVDGGTTFTLTLPIK